MNSYYFFIVVGIILSVLPFVGIPQGFKNIVFTFLGLLVIFIAQRFIKKNPSSEIPKETDTDSTLTTH